MIPAHHPKKELWEFFEEVKKKGLTLKSMLRASNPPRIKKHVPRLKPAGRDLGPAIPAADKAIVDGKIESIIKLLTNKMRDGVNEYFKHATAKKGFKKDDVEAGRKYIEAYVIFIHYVEALYEAAREAVHGHYPVPEEGEVHEHK